MNLPTLSRMIDLYGQAMALTLEARQFLRLMEQLRRLALNAEVLAVRVGQAAEVFQTLAREVGRITKEAHGVVHAIHRNALEVADEAVRTAALARLCEKYQQAVALGTEGATLRCMEARLDAQGQAMLADLAAISKNLAQAKAKLSDLEQLNLQLPMIATLLNIEANRDANTDPALTSNAASLLTVRKELGGLLERIRARADHTLSALAAAA